MWCNEGGMPRSLCSIMQNQKVFMKCLFVGESFHVHPTLSIAPVTSPLQLISPLFEYRPLLLLRARMYVMKCLFGESFHVHPTLSIAQVTSPLRLNSLLVQCRPLLLLRSFISCNCLQPSLLCGSLPMRFPSFCILFPQ